MLVEFRDRIINTDHIVSMTEGESSASGSTWTVHLTNGTSATIQATRSHIEQILGSIVPALPGHVLVQAFASNCGEKLTPVEYNHRPILAFQILTNMTAPYPIAIDGVPSEADGSRYVVLCPDGRCFGSEGKEWSSLDEFKADCERRASRRTAAAA